MDGWTDRWIAHWTAWKNALWGFEACVIDQNLSFLHIFRCFAVLRYFVYHFYTDALVLCENAHGSYQAVLWMSIINQWYSLFVEALDETSKFALVILMNSSAFQTTRGLKTRGQTHMKQTEMSKLKKRKSWKAEMWLRLRRSQQTSLQSCLLAPVGIARLANSITSQI